MENEFTIEMCDPDMKAVFLSTTLEERAAFVDELERRMAYREKS